MVRPGNSPVGKEDETLLLFPGSAGPSAISCSLQPARSSRGLSVLRKLHGELSLVPSRTLRGPTLSVHLLLVARAHAAAHAAAAATSGLFKSQFVIVPVRTPSLPTSPGSCCFVNSSGTRQLSLRPQVPGSNAFLVDMAPLLGFWLLSQQVGVFFRRNQYTKMILSSLHPISWSAFSAYLGWYHPHVPSHILAPHTYTKCRY